MDESEIVLRFYNKQAGSPKVSMKFKTFNKNYRRWVWNEWFSINTGGLIKEHLPKKGDPKGIKGTLGRATPFAHETTVGMEALEEMGVSLEADQSMAAFDHGHLRKGHPGLQEPQHQGGAGRLLCGQEAGVTGTEEEHNITAASWAAQR